MVRRLISTLTVLLVGVSFAAAQSSSIKGTVREAKTGEKLPGVNVVITSTQNGSATNADGKYTIMGVSPGTYTLQASFVGYKTYKAQIKVGSQPLTKNITLTPSVKGLEQVVVSALGFKEQSDQQGVSSANVSGEAVASSGETNIVSGLSAKAAGVNITNTGGDPGAASRIIIRGATSITGNNQPLFVVDGIPVYNSTFNNGVDGVQEQSRINDLNPENIQSVRVLKGPSAAALYGSRAANGVVLITTKSGSPTEGEKVNISVRSQLSYDQVNKTADLQRKFGQGIGGQYVPGYSLSWGDKIADRSGGQNVVDKSNGNAYFGPDGNKHGLITKKNSRKTYNHARDILDHGFKANNSVSISGGNETSTYYVNVANLTQNGIIKTNSDYDRTNLRGKASHDFGKLTAEVNAAYNNTSSNRIQQGSNISGLYLGAYRSPPDFNSYPATVDYIAEDGSIIPDGQRSFRNPVGAPGSPGYDNPVWLINNVRNHSRVRHFQGKTQLSYDPTSWLNIRERIGVDTYRDRQYAVFPVNDATNPTGALREEEIAQYQLNNDLIAKAEHTFNKDFSGSLLLGWNLNNRHTDDLGGNSTNIILQNFNRDLSNYTSKNPFQNRTTIRTAALYSVINLNAYDMFFLKLTGRQESASTFGTQTDGTYFYPSANLAWQFSQLKGLSNSDVLSFGKLRVSYGEAGQQPAAYQTSTTFFQGAFASGYGDALTPAEYGGGFARSAQAGNPRLAVQRNKEWEFGTDLRFFDNRYQLSLTYYRNHSENVILGVDRAPSSGFSSQQANAASLKNRGFEAKINFDVIQSKNFSWQINGNWSKNINTVTSLAGANQIALAGFTSLTSSAIEGEPYGILFGNQYRRASEEPISQSEKDNGFTKGKNDLVLDSNGFPTNADAQGIVGDPNPDWRAGIGSTVQFRNLKLNFLFDIKHGGDVWNGTKGALSYYGTVAYLGHETTAMQNLSTFDGQTIKKGTTFRGYVKDFGAGPRALTGPYYYSGPGSGFTGPAEQFIEDGGFVRLRKVSLGYSINGSKFRQFTGLRSIDLRVTGRNLLLFTDYTGIDPETNLTGPSNGFGLDYFNNPSTRSFIFTFQLNY